MPSEPRRSALVSDPFFVAFLILSFWFYICHDFPSSICLNMLSSSFLPNLFLFMCCVLHGKLPAVPLSIDGKFSLLFLCPAFAAVFLLQLFCCCRSLIEHHRLIFAAQQLCLNMSNIRCCQDLQDKIT